MSAPKERPILFSGPMVRALLDGQKTQTRRVVKREPLAWLDDSGFTPGFVADPANGFCTYGKPGDTLWVREAWALHERFSDVGRVVYAATANRSWTEAHRDFPVDLIGDRKARPFQEGFRPSIHMPRWASRLTLEITDVRVERLQDIGEADAMAEGASPCANGVWFDGKPEFAGSDARGAYYCLWEHINGAGSWAANPWVWAVSFRVMEADRAA